MKKRNNINNLTLLFLDKLSSIKAIGLKDAGALLNNQVKKNKIKT
jgi:hypothetical protein